MWASKFHGSYQKVIPLDLENKRYFWRQGDAFQSNEINALNFPKVIPLDQKYMIILGGSS